LSKAHCELGLLYQKHNDCFEALNEFDSALALLDDVDLSDPTHKVKAEFKATLQYQMGLNAKAMQDILQAVEFFTNAKKDLSPEAVRLGRA
jgi:tetratricopeptide (TPR) repeat protein